MKVTVTRTAMIGGGLAYDVLIKRRDAPSVPRTATTIIPSWAPYGPEHEYLHYEDATVSAEHLAMEPGIARWESWKRHEREARRQMLYIAALAFPELRRLQAIRDTLPLLWTFGLLDHETHAQCELDIDAIPPWAARTRRVAR